jgi:hypothetical protein
VGLAYLRGCNLCLGGAVLLQDRTVGGLSQGVFQPAIRVVTWQAILGDDDERA